MDPSRDIIGLSFLRRCLLIVITNNTRIEVKGRGVEGKHDVRDDNGEKLNLLWHMQLRGFSGYSWLLDHIGQLVTPS